MFEITLTIDPSLSTLSDLDQLLTRFLMSIGYLPKSPRGRVSSDITLSIPYRLFRDCFLRHPEKFWTPEELMHYLNTTRTTLYRHLNKLKELDMLEEYIDRKNKKYRLRYGSLEKAWIFVESNIKIAIEYYRECVRKIDRLSREVELWKA